MNFFLGKETTKIGFPVKTNISQVKTTYLKIGRFYDGILGEISMRSLV